MTFAEDFDSLWPLAQICKMLTFAEDFDSLWPLAQICKMLTAGKVDFKDFAVLVGQWLYELCGRSWC